MSDGQSTWQSKWGQFSDCHSMRSWVLLPIWCTVILYFLGIKFRLGSFKTSLQYFIFANKLTCTQSITHAHKHKGVWCQAIHDSEWWDPGEKMDRRAVQGSRQEDRIPAIVHWGWGWHLDTWWGRRSGLCWSHSLLAQDRLQWGSQPWCRIPPWER